MRTRRESRWSGGVRHGLTPMQLLFMLILSAVVVVSIWLYLERLAFRSSWSQLAAVSVMGVILGIFGIQRSRARLGRLDFFHPLVFPLSYIIVSFLAPIWITFATNDPVGSLSRPVPISPITPLLLCVGVMMFAVGAAVPFRSPTPSRRDGISDDVTLQSAVARASLGRLLLVVAIGVSAYQYARGGVLLRTVNQNDVGSADSIGAFAKLIAVAAVLVLVSAGTAINPQKVLSRGDLFLVLLLIVSIGVRGNRNAAITVMLLLIVAFSHARGKRRLGLLLGGFMGALVFAVMTVQYRNSILGSESTQSWWRGILADLAPVDFSVGAVAAAVPSSVPYAHGATLWEAIVRQLPGPIAVHLFGNPTDTGAFVFRSIIGLSDPRQGVGFSLAGEGYLNFGILGLAGTCFGVGLFFAYSYSRHDLGSPTVRGWAYALLVSVLPFALRSDFLGGIKVVLYPLLIAWAISVVAQLTLMVGGGSRRLRSPARRRSASALQRLNGSPADGRPPEVVARDLSWQSDGSQGAG